MIEVGKDIKQDLAYFAERQLEMYDYIKKLKGTAKKMLEQEKDVCDKMVESCFMHWVEVSKEDHPMLKKLLAKLSKKKKRPKRKAKVVQKVQEVVINEPIEKIQEKSVKEIVKKKVSGTCPYCISIHTDEEAIICDKDGNNVKNDNYVKCKCCAKVLFISGNRIVIQGDKK